MNLQLLNSAPPSAIPKVNTKAYQLLVLLATGEIVLEDEILNTLGKNFRAPLQCLMNEQNSFWNIRPVENNKGDIIGRQLDPRHLSKNPLLDARARAERRCVLANISLKESLHGQVRVGKALSELQAAEEHLLQLKK